MIFTQITSGGFDTFEEAQQAICLFYVPDMAISRSGISHALKRIEEYFSATILPQDDQDPNVVDPDGCADET